MVQAGMGCTFGGLRPANDRIASAAIRHSGSTRERPNEARKLSTESFPSYS
jgi:hypothetical protein